MEWLAIRPLEFVGMLSWSHRDTAALPSGNQNRENHAHDNERDQWAVALGAGVRAARADGWQDLSRGRVLGCHRLILSCGKVIRSDPAMSFKAGNLDRVRIDFIRLLGKRRPDFSIRVGNIGEDHDAETAGQINNSLNDGIVHSLRPANML